MLFRAWRGNLSQEIVELFQVVELFLGVLGYRDKILLTRRNFARAGSFPCEKLKIARRRRFFFEKWPFRANFRQFRGLVGCEMSAYLNPLAVLAQIDFSPETSI